jgi:hypothetical protein
MLLCFVIQPNDDFNPALQGVNVSHLYFLDRMDPKSRLQISLQFAAFFYVNQIEPVVINHFFHSPVPEEKMISDPDYCQNKQIIHQQPDEGSLKGYQGIHQGQTQTYE